MSATELVELLRERVGTDVVITDRDVVAGYSRDWTGRFDGRAGVLVRPVSTAQVAAVVRVCLEAKAAIVPQGGNTGLVGGGVPHHGEVLLSLRRMAGQPQIDSDSGQVTVQAGVPISVVNAAARSVGLAYGVDLASRDSATIGGTIATNAGGLRVLRHGDTRAQLIGVEAVLGDGTVISHLAGHTRDNTGYHLPSLLAGSEGTLAVVTTARLRLVAPSRGRAVAMLGMVGVGEAVNAAAELKRELGGLVAVELVLPSGLELVIRQCGLAPPLPNSHGAYLVVECDGAAAVDNLSVAADGLKGVQYAAVSDDPAGCAALWAYRERHTEAIASLGAAVKMDVTLPIRRAALFIERVPATVNAVSESALSWMFGHIADGNVHVNVTGAVHQAEQIEAAVFGLVASMGGSISTEHGIGVAKKPWLALNRSPREIAIFRRIKQAFDPAGILNPNVLLPDP